MKPVDALLNAVDWVPAEGVEPSDDMPYATHTGVLTISGVSFRCYQLSDGRRVIDAEDIKAFFGLRDE